MTGQLVYTPRCAEGNIGRIAQHPSIDDRRHRLQIMVGSNWRLRNSGTNILSVTHQIPNCNTSFKSDEQTPVRRGATSAVLLPESKRLSGECSRDGIHIRQEVSLSPAEIEPSIDSRVGASGLKRG